MHSEDAFWPWDYDLEDAIYESPAWDMPGLEKRPDRRPKRNPGPPATL
jgi:hypothetical protein